MKYLYAITELLVTFLLSIAILVSLYKIILLYLKARSNTTVPHNQAFFIFCAGVYLSAGLIFSTALDPLLLTIKMTYDRHADIVSNVGTAVGYTLMFFTITYLFVLFVQLATLFLFDKVTVMIDDVKEVIENNIGFAWFVSAALVFTSLISRIGITAILEALVPHPEVINIF
ncbi:MAG: hypothetical protein KIS94_05095 [Chitinophagales bacterium]|nr:hypothetical protein [Chitinophagales bacterium]